MATKICLLNNITFLTYHYSNIISWSSVLFFQDMIPQICFQKSFFSKRLFTNLLSNDGTAERISLIVTEHNRWLKIVWCLLGSQGWQKVTSVYVPEVHNIIYIYVCYLHGLWYIGSGVECKCSRSHIRSYYL